jgi:hypothetical protein
MGKLLSSERQTGKGATGVYLRPIYDILRSRTKHRFPSRMLELLRVLGPMPKAGGFTLIGCFSRETNRCPGFLKIHLIVSCNRQTMNTVQSFFMMCLCSTDP